MTVILFMNDNIGYLEFPLVIFYTLLEFPREIELTQCVCVFAHLIYLLKLDLLQEIASYGYGGWKVQNFQ